MTTQWDNIWRFSTKRFLVTLDCCYDQDADLSWDDTGETQEKCASGEWAVYGFRVAVYLDGNMIGEDALWGSVYADPHDFWKEHVGIRPLGRAKNCNYGCYFHDMLHVAVTEARKALCNAPRVRCAGSK